MNILAKTALPLIFVLGSIACTGNTASNIATENTNDSPITAFTTHTPKHLQFISTNVFDKQLSAAMNNKHHEIQLSMLTPFSTNDIPKKLDTWLTVIDDFGGEVKVESVEDIKSANGERGFIASIALALASVYKEYKDQEKYDPAQNYNATVFYKRNERGEAIVEKVVFSHKQKPVNIEEQ